MYIMTSAPSEDSGQTGHPPSLTRVYAVSLLYEKIRSQMLLHADSEDADQTDLSLR